MLSGLKSGLLGFCAALAASLCCLLPLAAVLLGLGSGAFMMVTMQYRAILLPIGLTGVAAGCYLYLREKRRCALGGCTFVSRRANLLLLVLATVMLAAEILLTVFPETTSRLLQGTM